MQAGNARSREQVRGLSRPFFATLASLGLGGIVWYVALSLGSAFTGSVAAVSLAPLVEPDQPLPAGFGWLVHGDPAMQATVFLGISASFALLRWQAARVGARLASRYGMYLRQTVHARLIDAPLSSLADATSAEVANVLTYNIEIATQGFSVMLQLLVAGLTTVVSLAMALWLSPPLLLAVPFVGALAWAASHASSREQAAVARQYVADLTHLFWLSEDFPRRWRHIRSFGRETVEKAHYADISQRLGRGYRRQMDLIASGRLMLEMLAALGIAAIFFVASRWHGVDRAALIAVCLLLGRLLPYLVSTRQSLQQLRSAIPAFELWLRYASATEEGPCSASVDTIDNTLHIRRLTTDAPTVLELSDLRLTPGELTLVCGDSGIGKTSLVDVLAGMVEPASFVARMGERTIDFSAYKTLVREGAYVSQSVRPWQRTVRECLQWAAPDATDAMMWQALVDVGLDKRLVDVSVALDTALSSSSSRLSGGELQRLLLAQVLLHRPRMAWLDEATSALDTEAELAVLSVLRRRLPTTILLVVSHRAGVACVADQCLTIRAGQATVSAVTRQDVANVAAI
ncbi:ABC transporter ATP-binding protein [Dyella sp. C11]|uniref:ATP-binding cassette domain-containing protein n=1 Tax=Dyella sp. C11 TaxID=2126991 RepID=UPI000D657407|nr:ABC transporter ATP-binding protein [Dyella sp. C11]